MNWLNDIIGVINNYLWSYVLIVMLIGIGLWFTVRTRFVQIRCIPEMFRLMTEGAGAKPREGHISTFQAFCVSTASRVGVGNIAGIAIAVATGGPGAVFWMWVIATIGAASGFVEPTRLRRISYAVFCLKKKKSSVSLGTMWLSASHVIDEVSESP